jgi:hypothetical protein
MVATSPDIPSTFRAMKRGKARALSQARYIYVLFLSSVFFFFETGSHPSWSKLESN